MILQRSREFAERVLVAHPNNYDAYLAPGIENYILSRKIAPMRFLMIASNTSAISSGDSAELSRELSAARPLAQHDWQEDTEA
jgi:hypothetical protein